MASAAEPIRLLIVDDHPLLREGIAGVVGGEPDLRLVAEAANGLEAVEQYRLHRPDVTLMDLQMSGMDGFAAIAAIRAEFPEAVIIVLTTYHGDAQAMRALKAGAAAYLLKKLLRRELVDTIRHVHRGGRRVTPEVAGELAEHVVADVPSERELAVLRLAAVGNSNKRIGLELGITEDTVKGHMKSLLAKLDARDRTHAVSIALRRGFIDNLA